MARCRGEFSTTPLHWAASQNNVEMIRLLIEHGAEPNATAMDGCTALHYAAREDCAEAAQVLLQSGASSAARNNAGNRPADEIYDDESEEGARLMRLLEHSFGESSLTSEQAPALRPSARSAPPPQPAGRWEGQAAWPGGGPAPAESNTPNGADVDSRTNGTNGTNGSHALSDGPAEAAEADDDEEWTAGPVAAGAGEVAVRLGADGRLADADYEAVRRAYEGRTMRERASEPLAAWHREEPAGGGGGGGGAVMAETGCGPSDDEEES